MDRTRLDDDGDPAWACTPGDELPGGALAWERLGVGHRCETWLAWSVPFWCPVVVKLLRPHQVGDPRALRSLGREVAALADNPHPALPALLADGRADAVPHLVFDYLEGPALDEELGRCGPMDPASAAGLGAEVLAALEMVHRRGLAHLDVKPANVIFRDGGPVLVDFGSARSLGTPAYPAVRPGAPGGTAGYAAPEAEAGEPVTAAMDLYGLGATLAEVLAGIPAFDPDGGPGRRAALPPSPTADLAAALLTPRPEDRPDTAETVRILAEIVAAADRPARPGWAAAYLRSGAEGRRPGSSRPRRPPGRVPAADRRRRR
jgi:serine/threonine protein kinase